MTILPTNVDVVIIGAGMAGLSVAAELSACSAASVLMLEAGPDAGHLHVRHACTEDEVLRLWLAPETDPNFWRPYETKGPHYRGLAGLRRRVGGRSLYWGGALLPIERWALDGGWPAAVAADLAISWRGGPSLYASVAAEIDVWAAAAPLPVHAPLDLAGKIFQPTPHAARSADTGPNIYSPLQKVIAASRPPAIVPQCHAIGVLTRGGRATGVRVRHGNQQADIAAAHVVLAAGTIENSRLAIQALADVGHMADHRLTGLVDKVAQGFTLVCPAADADPVVRHAAMRGATYHRSLDPALRSNHFVRLGMRQDGAIAFDTWLMGEQQRSADGMVHCLPDGQWPWPTHVTAALGEADEMLRDAQQTVLTDFWGDIRGLFGMGNSTLTFETIFGSGDLAERLLTSSAPCMRAGPVTYTFPLGCEQHEAGTTPLGTLLDDDHAFGAVPRLYAAGPSSFPRTGAANPVMTILALGKRLAGKLADK